MKENELSEDSYAFARFRFLQKCNSWFSPSGTWRCVNG